MARSCVLAALALAVSSGLTIAPDAFAAPAVDAVVAPGAFVADLSAAAAEEDAPAELWLSVRINRQGAADTVLVLRDAAGRLWFRDEDLSRWRIDIPVARPLRHGGEAYHDLSPFTDVMLELDEQAMTLAIAAPPGRFLGTVVSDLRQDRVRPPPAPAGGYLDYDLSLERGRGGSVASGLFELGVFNALGAGTVRFLARSPTAGVSLLRLDATWVRDLPDSLSSVRVGDAVSAAGSWGRSVRFGGVQWATDFSTQPGFVTFPLPGVRGEAVLPSTVDVFVNDALRARRDVPTGPFSLQDLPIVTGQGEARIVVRDLLGREQVITQSFYASPRVLRAGLDDFSYEAGFVRQNYGVASNDYGRFLLAGTHRRGLTDTVTGELHGEFLADQQTVGAGVAVLVPELGLFNVAAAASHARAGGGLLARFGFEHQSPVLSYGGTVQYATERFTQLGIPDGTRAPRLVANAYASVATERHGAFGMSFTRQDNRDQPDVDLLSASYSVSLPGLGFLSVAAIQALHGGSGRTVLVSFTVPLGSQVSASTSASLADAGSSATLTLNRSLPAGNGYGYRIEASAPDGPYRVAFDAQGDAGTYRIEAARFREATALRLGASGALVMLAGETFVSRVIDQSFGVVQVPGYPGVRVYADNQLVARTGADGSALVPRLRPYETNPIRIEQADLPLDADIDRLSAEAVPYRHSGVVVPFVVHRSAGATISVVLEDGRPLPTGSVATIAGRAEVFPSGRGGEIYLSGLSEHNDVAVTWRDQTCRFVVLNPTTADPLPHLGTYVCPGVQP